MTDSLDCQVNGKIENEEKTETNTENNIENVFDTSETKMVDSNEIINSDSNINKDAEKKCSVESSTEDTEATEEENKSETKKENKSETKEENKADAIDCNTKQESKKEDSQTEEVSMEEGNIDSSNTTEEKGNADEEDESNETPKVFSEKRHRKKVTRFSYDDAPSNIAEKKKVDIPDGKGTPLGEHPRVEMQIQKNRGEDLKIIHKFFFGVFGEALTCKKAIRQFRGFAFEKDSPEYEKKEEYLGKFTLDNLKWALSVCDVERKGKKEDLIDMMMEWSLCPKPSDKALPAKQKRKTPNKRNSLSGKQAIKRSSGKGDSPSKKKTATPKKSESPKKGFNFDDEDSETLATKKRKQPPTNAQIKKSIQKILKDANLEEITMKTVCLKIYALYPNYDITDRKAFIKETVKKIIS